MDNEAEARPSVRGFVHDEMVVGRSAAERAW